MLSRKILRLSWISLLSGILYNSWPLGYWLNNRVARVSLASGLEAVHQPYNWLFITTDIISSVLIVIVCGFLWKLYKDSKSSTHILMVLVCVVLFAIGTVVDALMPEHCVPNLMKCASFTQDHILLVHGLFSILASVFLFIALLILCWFRRKNMLLHILLAGYIVFGLISLAEAVAPGYGGNWSQYYYITLCSVFLVCLPYGVSLMAVTKKRLTT
ncbi:MAG: DUF998 domain-containing protein [Candidatus Saccharibacteria bacterium]